MVILTLLESQTNQPLNSWEFAEAITIRIGRAQDNDIVLKGYFQVSRKHIELTILNNQWHLSSSGTNGTFVNNTLVEQIILQDRDLIRLAENGPLFRFELPKTETTEITQSVTNEPEIIEAPQPCTHENNPPDSVFCIHCGQPLVEEERFIGSYQILRILGKGGMGTTYLVWNKNKTIQGAPFLLVLKEMNANMARIPKARELFEREARVLKSLDHPNIPKYYDFFVEGDRKYLVMELIHGHNLEQFTYSRGAVNPERAVEWMIQVCHTLAYLHSLEPSLVHRDIKPANLILRNLDSRIMLLDFGAVKELGTSLSTRIGVEGYSAPEQYRGKPCPQSDLYGIGTTLIFLVTGKTPMQYYAYESDRYEFKIDQIPHLSPQLQVVLKKTCQADPSDRYQTAYELLEALKGCL
jgi:serine/threonine protein kinase, bacterial